MLEGSTLIPNDVANIVERSNVKWSINNIQIKAIWEKVFQRIVALAWILEDEEPDYVKQLSEDNINGVIFRDREFRRVFNILRKKGSFGSTAIPEYPIGLPIWIDTDARLRTDFKLTPRPV